MKNYALKLMLVTFLTTSLVGCFNSSDSENKPIDDNALLEDQTSITKLRLKTVYGDIIIKLDHENAPLTSDRIRSLTKEGFYNGLSFHRVIPGHIIQTGDPTGSGDGGSGQNIPFEKNELTHEEGTVSMARNESDPNSADSQFFICLKKNSQLDGVYVAFGKVVEGIDVAKKITAGDKIITLTIE